MINNWGGGGPRCVAATRKMNHSNLTHRICMVNVMGRQDGHDCQDLSVERLFHHISLPCQQISIYRMRDTTKISSGSNTTKTQI